MFAPDFPLGAVVGIAAAMALVLVVAWQIRPDVPEATPPLPTEDPNAAPCELLATCLAWQPPDPEISLKLSLCLCGCGSSGVLVVAKWGEERILFLPAVVPSDALWGRLDDAAADLMATAPAFRIPDPVLHAQAGQGDRREGESI